MRHSLTKPHGITDDCPCLAEQIFYFKIFWGILPLIDSGWRDKEAGRETQGMTHWIKVSLQNRAKSIQNMWEYDRYGLERPLYDNYVLSFFIWLISLIEMFLS